MEGRVCAEGETIVEIHAPAIPSDTEEARLTGPPQDQTWRLGPESFESCRVDPIHSNAKTRAFYAKQNATIDMLTEALSRREYIAQNNDGEAQCLCQPELADEEEQQDSTVVTRAITISFTVNVLLTLIKLVAVLLSGSIAVLASFVDSLLDLAAGLILWWTARRIAARDPFKFPVGKTRLEPVGTLLFAAVMAMSSLQIAMEAGKRLADGFNGNPDELEVGPVTIIVLCVTIVTKAVLYWYCSAVAAQNNSPSVEAYAQDHRNDVLTNLVASVGAIVASQFSFLWMADSMGALAVCLYIIVTWGETGKEQIQMLCGRAASNEFLQQITCLVLNHAQAILKVDTVRAYHFGVSMFVEVDIVLPEDMPLKQSHDIAEALQIKLEQMEDVERAFVHTDWEWKHPAEHKMI